MMEDFYFSDMECFDDFFFFPFLKKNTIKSNQIKCGGCTYTVCCMYRIDGFVLTRENCFAE